MVRIGAMKNFEIFEFIIKGMAVVISLIILGIIFSPNLRSVSRFHHKCNDKFEAEAHAIAAATADYFSDPARTKIPSIDDLVRTGGYAPIDNGQTKNGYKLVEESEFSVAILGADASQITIVLTSKKGRCPFDKGKCRRRFMGQYYVYKMYGDGGGAWQNNYQENGKQ